MDSEKDNLNQEADIQVLVRAANKGCAEDQYMLGHFYFRGLYVEQSYEEALKWFRLAAAQNYAEAQQRIGLCYAKGWGVPQSYDEAVKWYRLAVDQNNAAAQYDLGWCFYEGNGVPQSEEEAIKWFTKSADQGYLNAQTTLYQIYIKSENDKEGLKYLQKAAEQGDAAAQTFLGRSYQYGYLGLPRSVETAIKYYKLAAAQGNKEAQERLEEAQEVLEAEEEIESNFNILLNKYNQSSNSAERKRLYGKLVEISNGYEQATGKKLLDEATIAEGCDCGTVNESGSKSGCMVLAVLMLSPVVAAVCYGIYSLLA